MNKVTTDKNEQSFFNFLHCLIGGVILTDEKGYVLLVNNSAKKILNLQKTIKTKPIQKVFHVYNKKTKTAILFPLEKILHTKKPFFLPNVISVNQNNIKIAIDLNVIAHDISEKTYIVFLFHDHSHNEKVQQQLQLTQNQYKQAQHIAHIGHWELDSLDGTPFWSEEVYHIFGLNPETDTLSFFNYKNHVHPDDWGILSDSVTQAFTNGKSFDIIFRVIRPSKTVRWLHAVGKAYKDNSNKITKIFGTVQDITSKKKLEHALIQSQHHNAFLNQVSIDLLKLNSIKDMYEYTAHALHSLLNNQSIISIVEYDTTKNQWQMQYIHGLGKKLTEVSKIFGFNINKMKGDISTKYYDKILSGTLEEMEFDFPGLFNNKLSDALGKTVKKLLSIKKMYCIAFKQNNQLYGNITFTTNNKTGPINTDLIEAFVRTVSIFIMRKKTEDTIRQSEDRFQKMLSLVPDMISVIDKNMNIMYSNWNGFAAVPKEKRVVNTKCYKTYRNFDNLCPDCKARTVLHNKKTYEKEVQLPDGTYVDLRVIPIIEKDGSVELFIEWVRDISDRKKSEKNLRESEEKHRRLYETMAQGIIYQSADGTIISANPAAERILGITLDQMKGKTSMDPHWKMIMEDGTAVHGKDHPAMIALRTGQTIGPVTRGIYRPDLQSHIWLNITAIPLFQPGKTKPFQAYAVIEDITKEKQLKQQIIKNKNLLERTEQIAKVGGWEIDGVTHHITWTKEIYRIHEVDQNYNPSLQQSINFFHPEDREQLSNAIKKALKQAIPYDMELRFITSKGKKLWIRFIGTPQIKNGKVTKIIGTFQDITTIKTAELDVLESKKQLEIFFSQSLDGFFFMMLDTPIEWNESIDKEKTLDYIFHHQKMTKVNQALLDQYKAKKEEFIGLTPYDLFKHDLAHGRHIWRGLFDQGRWQVETNERRMDGSQMWVQGDYICMYDSLGRIIGHFGIQTDITQQKKNQQQIKNNESRLESLVKIMQFQPQNIQELLDYALHEAIRLTESTIGYIYFYNEEKKEFTLNSWSKNVMDQCLVKNQQTVYNLDETGIWGEAVRQRKEIIINNYQSPHPLKKGYPEGHAPLYKFLTIPIFSNGKIVAVLGVANKKTDYDTDDVIQLKLLMDGVWKEVEKQKGVRALQQSEEKYRTITDNIVDVVWRTDLEFNTVYVSPSIQKLTGFSVENYKTMKLSKKYPVSCILEFQKTLKQELEKEKNETIDKNRIIQFETQQYHSDGRLLDIAMHISFIRNQYGKPIGLQGVTRDITQQKKSQELKNRFIAQTSHELINPLIILEGYTQLLLQEAYGEMKKEQQIHIQQMYNKILILRKVISDVVREKKYLGENL